MLGQIGLIWRQSTILSYLPKPLFSATPNQILSGHIFLNFTKTYWSKFFRGSMMKRRSPCCLPSFQFWITFQPVSQNQLFKVLEKYFPSTGKLLTKSRSWQMYFSSAYSIFYIKRGFFGQLAGSAGPAHQMKQWCWSAAKYPPQENPTGFSAQASNPSPRFAPNSCPQADSQDKPVAFSL